MLPPHHAHSDRPDQGWLRSCHRHHGIILPSQGSLHSQQNLGWQAVHEFTFLGWRVFLQNMVLCPSRVGFLISCLLVQVLTSSASPSQFAVPCRVFCLYHVEDTLCQVISLLASKNVQIVMMCNGWYFLFFCRGFKLVGPMVIMIYRLELWQATSPGCWPRTS